MKVKNSVFDKIRPILLPLMDATETAKKEAPLAHFVAACKCLGTFAMHSTASEFGLSLIIHHDS